MSETLPPVNADAVEPVNETEPPMFAAVAMPTTIDPFAESADPVSMCASPEIPALPVCILTAPLVS